MHASVPVGGSKPRVLLLGRSLEGGDGVSCVARLIERLLREREQGGELDLDVRVLSGPAKQDMRVASSGGSWIRFVAGAQMSLRSCAHVVADCCNMAQAAWNPVVHRPLATFIHGVEVWEGAPARRLAMAHRAELLLSNSRYTISRAHAAHHMRVKASVCPLATETDSKPSEGCPMESRAPRILIVGRMMASERYKGHRELLACWPAVRRAIPGALLDIVGTGDDVEALCQQARQCGMEEAVRFHGRIDDTRLERLYSSAVAFAMPSRGEGFGLVYVEAMRHSLPVIASVHDAGPEIVMDGETGFTVSLDRPGELQDRVIQILKNRAIAEELGRAGQRRWQEHYSWSAFRRRAMPLLASFLGGDA